MKHLPKITIEVVEHKDQRYPTVGDWTTGEDGSLNLKISKMSNWKYEAAVAIHELIESLDCIDKDISQDTVDQFDMAFEELRKENDFFLAGVEPGNLENAPYRVSHETATAVEKVYIGYNHISWQDYSKEIDSL